MTAFPPPTLPAEAASATYLCPYCRLQGDATGSSCPHCGAPVDVRAKVSTSGWEAQPSIRDMAKIQFGQSSCQISGAYVPAAEIRLGPGESIYFSHHVLLWCDTTVQMGNQPLQGGWSRMMAGMPLIMMEAHGPGSLALSDNHPGETIAVPLNPGRTIDVREHRFVMASGNVGYQWFNTGVYYRTRSGDETETHYPAGMFMDRFGASHQPGLLLIHSPGNVFLRDLSPGQTTTIHPGALVWKDSSVDMSLHLERPAGSSFSRYWQPTTPWLRLRGPGRIAIASVFPHMEGTGRIISNSGASITDWNQLGITRRPAQQSGFAPDAAPADPLVAVLTAALGAFAGSQGFHPSTAGGPSTMLMFSHDSGIHIAVEVAPPGSPGLTAPAQPVAGVGDGAFWRPEQNGFALEVRKGQRAVNVHVTGPIPPQDQFGWARAFATTAVSCM